ncbi:transketolase [Mycetocola reblochoni]|uniref:Transketolase, N-terminal section n=2 Tax=Mycetocola reblochoni TaxID=331618 RepID=A0A1R4IH72_9MICO|nr:transketolase [Mycetocola reblochoni]RLP69692.1 transketolase [Mycetocola reblochoni]SJN19088.1 Transketolase, N-terminal section [Mycetocola reblochoni REB411]
MNLTPPQRPSTDELRLLADTGRWNVISTVAASKAGHIGGPLSAMDLLVALYFGQLRIDPAQPRHPERDRFILSKGHNAIALYTVLAQRGYFPESELASFDHGDSRLQGHPDMKLTPGVDASTGSLGQGLSAGAGMALGAKRRGLDAHTWVMLGDGELGEGMVWETVLSAPRFGLDNLTAIVDVNGLQQYGWPAGESDRFDRSEPLGHVDLGAVFTGFGWTVHDIDGHDFTAIFDAFDAAEAARNHAGRPSVILARTAKGRGVSFTEGTYTWHNGVATEEQLRTAKAELLEKGEVR